MNREGRGLTIPLALGLVVLAVIGALLFNVMKGDRNVVTGTPTTTQSTTGAGPVSPTTPRDATETPGPEQRPANPATAR